MLNCFAYLVTSVWQCGTYALTLEKVDCGEVDPIQTLDVRNYIVSGVSLQRRVSLVCKQLVR